MESIENTTYIKNQERVIELMHRDTKWIFLSAEMHTLATDMECINNRMPPSQVIACLCVMASRFKPKNLSKAQFIKGMLEITSDNLVELITDDEPEVNK